MIELFATLALMLVLAVGFLFRAFRGGSTVSTASSSQAQRVFYRQRLQELDVERSSQWLDEEEYQALERDLERQLLSESGAASKPRLERPQVGDAIHRWAVGIPVAILLLSGPWLYQQLGAYNELALYHKQQQLADKQEWTPEDVRALQALTARSLSQRPDKPELLWLQARLQMELGDYDTAAMTYGRLVEQLPDDASALAQWAQAQYLANGRQLDATIKDQLQRVLVLEPRQTTALGILGIDAFSRGEYLRAVELWQRLQKLLSPGSAQLAAISEGLQRAKLAALEAGDMQGLVVEVNISDSLAARAQGWLYVFARAGDGSPLPVAVARMPVLGDWPRRVVLSDADAMAPTRKLSQFDQVSLTARISRSGNAMASSGDLEGFLPAFSVASEAAVARIEIDREHP